jgi:hypothetical protein
MAIDKSRKWWIGSEPGDLKEYLDAYSEENYPIHEFRLARCKCGSKSFRLEFDGEEGGARRTCPKCSKSQFLCDSEEYWEDAEPEPWSCIECQSDNCNVAAGFALYEDLQNIKWLYVGVRCAECGVLGCCAEWKVGYDPSLQLMDQV